MIKGTGLFLTATLLGLEPASARMAYTYLNSGYCPDMTHVQDVSQCGKHQNGKNQSTNPIH
jgi:hypothetical protein